MREWCVTSLRKNLNQALSSSLVDFVLYNAPESIDLHDLSCPRLSLVQEACALEHYAYLELIESLDLDAASPHLSDLAHGIR